MGRVIVDCELCYEKPPRGCVVCFGCGAYVCDECLNEDKCVVCIRDEEFVDDNLGEDDD